MNNNQQPQMGPTQQPTAQPQIVVQQQVPVTPQSSVPGVKSATVAGLLGIFLGGLGVHNFYLGDKKKGIIHLCMAGGALVLNIITGMVLPEVLSYSLIRTLAWLFFILGGASWIAAIASGIWGVVEGIQILTGGDAALAAKGIPVATPQQIIVQQPGQIVQQPVITQPVVTQPGQTIITTVQPQQPVPPTNQPGSQQPQQ